MHLLHHAAAEHDHLRRYRDDHVHAHLRQIRRLQLPRGVILGHQLGGKPPALFNRGAAGQPFEAVPMIRAYAVGHGVALLRREDHVPHFRVHQSVHHLAVDHQTAANARAHRHIQQAAVPLARAHGVFRQRRVHIRVDARGHAQRVLERGHQRILDPFLLRGLGDAAVGRRGRVQIQRAEGADAQRLHVEFPDKIHNLRHGDVGRERRKAGALKLKNLPIFVSDCADHLGSARLQCANEHNVPPSLRAASRPPLVGRLISSARFLALFSDP